MQRLKVIANVNEDEEMGEDGANKELISFILLNKISES